MSRVNGTLNGTVNDSPLTDADASTEAVVGSIRPLPGRVSTPVTFPLMVLIHGPFLQRQRGGPNGRSPEEPVQRARPGLESARQLGLERKGTRMNSSQQYANRRTHYTRKKKKKK